jgi:hypothetical protein
MGDRQQAHLLLNMLREIYNPDKKVGFPLHKRYYVSPTLETIGVRSPRNIRGLVQLRENHNNLLAAIHTISTNTIVAINSPPMGIEAEERGTLRDIIMGIKDPYKNSQNLFQEVWMGVADTKTHFIVMTEQEPVAVECIDVLGKIVTTRYHSYNEEGDNCYWQWFTPSHKLEMEKLIFDNNSNRWIVNSQDPLAEVLKAMTDLTLIEETHDDNNEQPCIISSIQIIDAFWKTSRMGGVECDRDLSSMTTRESANTLSLIGEESTWNLDKDTEDAETEYTHQSLGGSTITNHSSLLSGSSEITLCTLHAEGPRKEEEKDGNQEAEKTAAILANLTNIVPPPQETKKKNGSTQLEEERANNGGNRDRMKISLLDETPPTVMKEKHELSGQYNIGSDKELPYFSQVAELLDSEMEQPGNLHEVFQDAHLITEAWMASLSSLRGRS